MNDKYLTVSAVTRYLKHKIEDDSNLRNLFIKGEISNFKAHSSGHFYFSIKDENSIIKAIMFSANAKKLNFIPTDGMKILVMGSVSVYEATGNYQIYVNELIEDGIGNLYIAFEKLKEKLSAEGLFDLKYKKEIPAYPKKIGIITASTGAAIKDILSTIKRRYPICETYLFPCLVQGETASIDINNKIKQADNFGLDVIIVGRGGGSFEDMNCFNDETLARTVFMAKTPIISAVGHEIDYTIIDFVSDLRAPTPTGAAEMAVPNILDLNNTIKQYNIRLNEVIINNINYKKLLMDSIKNSFVIKNPMLMYNNKKQEIDLKTEKISNIIKQLINNKNEKIKSYKNSFVIKNPNIIYKNRIINLNRLIEKLELLNPLSILKRGYNITYKNNKIIKTIKEVKINDKINIKYFDGSLEAIIERIGE